MIASEGKLTFLERVRDWDFERVIAWESGVSFIFWAIAIAVCGRDYLYSVSLGVICYWLVGWFVFTGLLSKLFFRATIAECCMLIMFVFFSGVIGSILGLVINAFL